MIYIVNMKHWEDLFLFANRLPGYAIRGQSCFNWTLSTHFERLTNKFREEKIHLGNREKHILDQFKRRAHNVINQPPNNDEDLEWLSIIQHYGGPTRLLDFTKSFYVGLFFACEAATEDSAIWMIDYFNLSDKQLPRTNSQNIEDQRKAFIATAKDYIGSDKSDSGLLPVETERLNERMSTQQGMFLFPKNINESFMENLRIEYNWDDIQYEEIDFQNLIKKLSIGDSTRPQVIKLRIDFKWNFLMLNLLEEMNINAKSLFPGIVGFARSMKFHITWPI